MWNCLCVTNYSAADGNVTRMRTLPSLVVSDYPFFPRKTNPQIYFFISHLLYPFSFCQDAQLPLNGHWRRWMLSAARWYNYGICQHGLISWQPAKLWPLGHNAEMFIVSTTISVFHPSTFLSFTSWEMD